MTEFIRTYRQYISRVRRSERLRRNIRDGLVSVVSHVVPSPSRSSWIRFLNYHHLFDDERAAFEKQLAFLGNFSEFISLDDALELLNSNQPMDGRYVCFTMDDGYKNLLNAIPILAEHRAPTAIFVATQYILSEAEKDAGGFPSLEEDLYKNGKPQLEFLNWSDCKQLSENGITIGSHTVSHRRMIDLSEQEVEFEMQESKKTIEAVLERPCIHFSCPWGRPSLDFDPQREPEIASRVGYRSFLTGKRGSQRRVSTPLMIERDHVIAAWGTPYLRFILAV